MFIKPWLDSSRDMGTCLTMDLLYYYPGIFHLLQEAKFGQWIGLFKTVVCERRGAVFHQDNSMSVVTRQKLCELGWKALMHPPYSPDLAPNDGHLFLALQNFQSDKKLGLREDWEN
ncbi:histone-lysine N-methyltransferase SETMAR [Trichonephila clavipes]|nr:histone-lysine N-methyltransferase SETMAR [Trichonephila clavipes]